MREDTMSKSPSAQDIINLLDASPYEMKVKDMADVFKVKVSSRPMTRCAGSCTA